MRNWYQQVTAVQLENPSSTVEVRETKAVNLNAGQIILENTSVKLLILYKIKL